MQPEHPGFDTARRKLTNRKRFSVGGQQAGMLYVHCMTLKKKLQILKHKKLETPGEQADATQEWKGRGFHHTFASFDTSLLCVQLRFCGADVAADFSLGACLITGMTKHFLCQIVEVLQSPKKTTK